MGNVQYRPGDIVDIGGDQHVVVKVDKQVHANGTMDSHIEFGSIYDQLLYPDKDQCGELVKRDQLTRRCRRCVEAELMEKGPAISMGSTVITKKGNK
jgi:hypothetical protein